MKKQFTLIAWITLIMTLLLSSCQKFEEDAIQKLAYGKDESGRHFVDLGLSVKWATCNIGADAPEQQGLLYAWGETSPKEEYTWDNYKFGPDTALSKYCAKPDVAWHGFTDTKITLELSDDAAHVNWRGRWRMPTQAEWNELIEKCTWTQTEYMGVKGYDVKAANGNRIFLPAPDENALYASSSLLETRPGEALHLPIFDQYDVLTAQYRYRAYSVRAVYGSLLPQYSLITFDANGGVGIMHPQQYSKGGLIPLTEVRFTKQASVFSSWNTKADGSGTSYKDKASIITDKSFTIYAQWTPCYTITFDANGGEGTMDSLTIVSGTKKLLPANTFTRSGYVFAAWNTKADGSGTAYKESSEIAPTENLTLYAQWTPCYTITFDANGGEGTMDSLTIAQGEECQLPANTFTRNGYVFAGWNTKADGSGSTYNESSKIAPTESMTLYAQWTPCYTITFDANGGKGSMAPQKAIKGEEFSISSNVFTRSGYSFTAWNTKADGSGTSYVNNQVIILSQDITLYAQWKKLKGTESGHEWVDLGLPSGLKWATCNVGATTPEGYGNYFAWGETSPKDSYTWSAYKYCNGSSSTLTKYNTSSNYGTVDNKTILDLSDDAARANWGGTWRMPTYNEWDELKNNCTWEWTTQNGVNGYKVTSKTNGNSIFLPEAGYRNGTSVYNVGSYGRYWSSSLYESRPYTYRAYYLYFSSGNVYWGYSDRYNGHTVRAVFSEKDAPSRKFIVVFNANGGSGTMSAQQIMAGVSHPLSANTFTREGYTFVGWNTAPDGSGTSYTDKQVVALMEDLTLYAQWKQRIFYSVTFKANGGLGTMADQVFEAGVSHALVSNAFIRDGYTFIGWNTTPDGSGTSYTNKQVVTLTEDITLYAQWDQRFYVSFEANGGTGEMEVQTFTSGEKKTLLACTFTNLGYLFSGWNTEADGSGTSYSDKQIISVTQDLTLYAQWKRGIYTVTFDANGGTGFMSAQTFEGGVSQALASNSFTRAGYSFINWNTSPDGSGMSYTDQQELTLTQDLTLYAQWREKVLKGTENGYEWVDLGLPSGLKWATCNVGATSPEGYGDYFAWGETSPKNNYDWSTYKYCKGSYGTMTKYCTDRSCGYNGFTDNKTTLELSDDAAHTNWGGKWRMPTITEQRELIENCTWTWTTQNGVNGYSVISKSNGNNIFLPAAGDRYGNLVFDVGSSSYYGSSSLYESYPDGAYGLNFASSNVDWSSYFRFEGIPVRAVCP